MAVRRQHLKNDPDRRMDMLVAGTRVFLPEKDVLALDRRNLDQWIAELRRGESEVRQLRQRLEALQAEVDRPCPGPGCRRQVTGRADAVYCSSGCRVRAHRRAKGSGTDASRGDAALRQRGSPRRDYRTLDQGRLYPIRVPSVGGSNTGGW
jgi:hypothetical protein